MNKVYEKATVGLLGLLCMLGVWTVKTTADGREALAANTVAVRNLKETVDGLEARNVPRPEVEARLAEIKTRLSAIDAEIIRIKTANNLR